MSSNFKSSIKKRSVKIGGHATSVSIEDAFWVALIDLAKAENTSVQSLIERIDAEKSGKNLSSAVRLYVFESYRKSKPRPSVARRSASA